MEGLNRKCQDLVRNYKVLYSKCMNLHRKCEDRTSKCKKRKGFDRKQKYFIRKYVELSLKSTVSIPNAPVCDSTRIYL